MDPLTFAQTYGWIEVLVGSIKITALVILCGFALKREYSHYQTRIANRIMNDHQKLLRLEVSQPELSGLVMKVSFSVLSPRT